MLLRAFSQITSSPFEGLVTVFTFCLALALAITVHEFSHALAATQLGDPTPRRQGRLSLHPLAHLDTLGTAMLLFAGFGWGKPVQTDPRYLRIGPRSGMAVVSLAGPLSNVLLATLASIPLRTGAVSSGPVGFLLFQGQPQDIPGFVIGSVLFWNLLLAAFNLIPIAPLDGFKVALGVLPRELAFRFARLERYGPAILLTLIMLPFLIPGTNVLSPLIRLILNALSAIILGGQIWG